MTPSLGTYPFGQPLRRVVQMDRAPKKVFVLGVYASAVHARWVSPEGRTLITALAVDSEPYIFWRGDGVEEIVAGIRIPEGAGKLVAASSQSGISLPMRRRAIHASPRGFLRCWLRESRDRNAAVPDERSHPSPTLGAFDIEKCPYNDPDDARPL